MSNLVGFDPDTMKPAPPRVDPRQAGPATQDMGSMHSGELGGLLGNGSTPNPNPFDAIRERQAEPDVQEIVQQVAGRLSQGSPGPLAENKVGGVQLRWHPKQPGYSKLSEPQGGAASPDHRPAFQDPRQIADPKRREPCLFDPDSTSMPRQSHPSNEEPRVRLRTLRSRLCRAHAETSRPSSKLCSSSSCTQRTGLDRFRPRLRSRSTW